MKKAIVLDKSGTIVDPCRIIYNLESHECLYHINTLKYVIDRGEALVNLRGPLNSLFNGKIGKISLKASCASFTPLPKIDPVLIEDARVVEGIKIVLNEAINHCGSQMGACAALIIDHKGRITHTVGLGGRLYPEVKGSVQNMKKIGIDIFLATGNCRKMSMDCSKLLNIPREYVLFDASPEDKRDLVKKLRGFYGSVIMVGNDLNDLIAMKEADVSIIISRAGAKTHVKVTECMDVDYVVPSLIDVEAIVENITHP
ncbi:MAG: HAD family hydrolase [Candidatus Methanomethylicus sp.]|nr:HAD family hydrolase [Candidatus Methanomethylicus sp.]